MEIHITGTNAGPWQFSERGSGDGVIKWHPVAIPFTAGGALATVGFHDTSDTTRSIDLLLDHIVLLETPPGFVLVDPGTFQMGSPENESGHGINEQLHQVSFARFMLARETEVTWNEWNTVRSQAQSRGYTDLGPGRNGYNGSPAGDHPVTEVSWWDAIKWCNLRSELEGLAPVYHVGSGWSSSSVMRRGTATPRIDPDADGYRLPTESEWEYICRAGTTTAFFNGPRAPYGIGDADATLDQSSWYAFTSGDNTHPVATNMMNPWGFFDVHGNVWEWCWDLYADDYPAGPVTDPLGAATGYDRVLRGGSFHMTSYWCRAAQRGWHSPEQRQWYLGFRVVRSVPQ